MNEVRVGMVRCDLHAYWYAAFFAPHDPTLLAERHPCLHWLFYGGYWDKPNELAIPGVSGFRLAKLWDADRETAREMSRTFLGAPEVCESIEEVYEGIDLLFIADCFTEGKDHLELAGPGLKKGIPTFVDKPLAYTLKDAREIVRLAEEHGAPLLSSSLLRLSPDADRFRARFAEIEPVVLGVVRGAVGVNGNLQGIFHVLSLAQNLFGSGVEWVECMGDRPLEYLHLHYPRGGAGGFDVMAVSSYVVARDIYCGFRADVYGRTGVIHSPFIDDFAFPRAGERILGMLKRMAASGEPPLSYGEMTELIRIVEAGRVAQERGRKVYLQDVR